MRESEERVGAWKHIAWRLQPEMKALVSDKAVLEQQLEEQVQLTQMAHFAAAERELELEAQIRPLVSAVNEAEREAQRQSVATNEAKREAAALRSAAESQADRWAKEVPANFLCSSSSRRRTYCGLSDR